MHLGLQERLELSKRCVRSMGKHADRIIIDTINSETGADFEPFCYQFEKVTQRIIGGEKLAPKTNTLERIMYDYFRLQIARIYQITIDKRGLLGKEIDYSLFGSEKFDKHVKAKHERDFVAVTLDHFLDNIAGLFEHLGEEKLHGKALSFKQSAPKAKIPLPKPIPKYIESWQNRMSDRSSISVEDIL